jgi:purine-binding chemotaxis protein CheW
MASVQQAAASAEKFLTFGVGDETYAMAIGQIREVLQYEDVGRVPLMPAFVRGILNLRGTVVPVIDLAVRFDRSASAVGRRTCIVVIEVPTAEGVVVLGALVDHVKEVLDFERGTIEPAPAFGAAVRKDFIRGIGRNQGRFVIVLDVGHVLSVDELASVSGAAHG